jgi:AAA+ superfamily predicted ATPase
MGKPTKRGAARESGSKGDRQSNEIYKRKIQLLPSILITVDLYRSDAINLTRRKQFLRVERVRALHRHI